MKKRILALLLSLILLFALITGCTPAAGVPSAAPETSAPVTLPPASAAPAPTPTPTAAPDSTPAPAGN